MSWSTQGKVLGSGTYYSIADKFDVYPPNISRNEVCFLELYGTVTDFADGTWIVKNKIKYLHLRIDGSPPATSVPPNFADSDYDEHEDYVKSARDVRVQILRAEHRRIALALAEESE